MLSDERKREFMRNGFLVVPNVVEESLLEAWRAAVWDAIPVDRDAEPISYLDADDQTVWEDIDWGPLREVHEQVFPYVEALLGEGNVATEEVGFQQTVRFADPESKVKQPSDSGGHIDGYGGDGHKKTVRGSSLNQAIYMDRVEPRGGGFTVWPGAHWKAAQYWQVYPELSWTDYWVEHHEPPYETGDPFEIAADAGSVVLWHGKLAHSSGVNHSLRPRMATFRRFQHATYAENRDDSIRHPFKYWTGMEGIELDDFSQPRLRGIRE